MLDRLGHKMKLLFPGGKMEPGEALHLNEHEAAAWLTKDTLFSVRWLPADEGILHMIMQSLNY